LEFEQHLQSGKRYGPSLLNAANRRVVRGLARAARSVLNCIDAVAVQNPFNSLADDVAATKSVLDSQDGAVILAGIC